MPSKKIHIVTMPQLNRALATVSDELHSHGLWEDQAEHVDVILGTIGSAFGVYGWQDTGEAGEIVIPSFSGSKLMDRFWHGEYTPLTDVLRHEFGHALANMNKALVRSSKFTDAFDGSHDCGTEFEYDPDVHVTGYASTDPSEDWAEVFMFYLKYDGSLPSSLDTPTIRAKWAFVRKFAAAVRSGRRRWSA